MERLNPDNLAALAPTVKQPGYDRNSVQAGILHFGLGAFHRAHQAEYTDTAMENGGGNWGIIGVSLRSDSVFHQLDPQDGLYTVMAEDGHSRSLKLVGAIKQVLVAPREPQQVISYLADASIQIITLTITEKGYCLAADGTSLDTSSSAIASDLENPLQPLSVIGLLARGLQQRFQNGGPPLTVISCDNLVENSALLRNVLVDYLGMSFPEVLPWLEAAVTFPCSMVDRIVPAMNAERIARQAEYVGLCDAAAITTEPFCQWVVENDFAGDKPDWESAGVQFVDDIRAYEAIKLGLLNATHSAIAYLGLLAGHTTVDEVMTDQRLGAFVEELMLDTLMPALEVPATFDLVNYRQQLLERFSNPRLQHRCQQIAMDGSEKIPQRWIPALNASVEANALYKALSFWCYFVLFTQFEIEDSRSEQLTKLRESESVLPERIIAVLDCARINARTVSAFDQLKDVVVQQVELLRGNNVYELLG